MNQLALEVDGGREAFQPGESIEVTAAWDLAERPQRIELRLVWFTQGKGDEDISIVKTIRRDAPPARDKWTASLTLPAAPYSFSGKLVSLIWTLELIAEPSGDSTRRDIVIAPRRREIDLYAGKKSEIPAGPSKEMT